MTFKNYSRYRVNPKKKCNIMFWSLLKGSHSKKAYRDRLIKKINFYEHDYLGFSGSEFVKMFREELERLDRLVDR